ncbi:Transcription factor fungi [Macrophomina phaseolina MS6]|uniref:Transcription factor fungi n=1 Tax=Macrophomina phaseolina (strain MS6) TaxID=1126212 RepID=K2RUY7_MACPH|nr:Transcription factor fungi [Macrophomina phaseolina MS6]
MNAKPTKATQELSLPAAQAVSGHRRNAIHAISASTRNFNLRDGANERIALVGSTIAPPALTHGSSDDYYNRIKALFQGGHEENPVTSIIALMMLYWRGKPSPSVVSIDAVWWWTGVAIRLAQQIGLHRELKPGQALRPGETPGLRRRIWWTLYGRPCIIDPNDCDIAEPTTADFPSPVDAPRAEIFVRWVQLCGIIGRLGKHLSKSAEAASTPPQSLAAELSAWVHSLPAHLQLPIADELTLKFDRNVHQLHLPYLTAVMLLHLERSSAQPSPLPQARAAAVLASACVARVFEDLLARGRVRFLQGMAGWYAAIALLALLHARRVGGERLRAAADAHIRILRLALRELARLWSSARQLDEAFAKMIGADDEAGGSAAQGVGAQTHGLDDMEAEIGFDLMGFFPYVTSKTSPLVRIMLGADPITLFAATKWPEDLMAQMQEFFGPLEEADFSGSSGAVGARF